MEHEYWNRKTKGHEGSMQRVGQYLKTHLGKEQSLRQLMEAAEKFYPHTQRTFAHPFVRAVMDEVEAGNGQRVRDAINLAERGHRGGLIGALEKVKQDETRRRIRERLPESLWVDGIKDHDIVAAHGILQDFEERKIDLAHVDT